MDLSKRGSSQKRELRFSVKESTSSTSKTVNMFNGYNQPPFESDPNRVNALKKTGHLPGWQYGDQYFNQEIPQQPVTNAWHPKQYQHIPSKCSCAECQQGAWYHKDHGNINGPTAGSAQEMMVMGQSGGSCSFSTENPFNRQENYPRPNTHVNKPFNACSYANPHQPQNQPFAPKPPAVKHPTNVDYTNFDRNCEPYYHMYETSAYARKQPDQRPKYWENPNGAFYPADISHMQQMQFQQPCRYPYNPPYFYQSSSSVQAPYQPPHQGAANSYYGGMPSQGRQEGQHAQSIAASFLKQDSMANKISPLRLMRKKRLMGNLGPASPPRSNQPSDCPPALDVRRFLATWADDEESQPVPQLVVLDYQEINPEQAELLRLCEDPANRIPPEPPLQPVQEVRITELASRPIAAPAIAEKPAEVELVPENIIAQHKPNDDVLTNMKENLQGSLQKVSGDPQTPETSSSASSPSNSSESLPLLPTSEYRKNKFLDYDQPLLPQLPLVPAVPVITKTDPVLNDTSVTLTAAATEAENAVKECDSKGKKTGKRRTRKPTIKFSIEKSHDLKISLRVLNESKRQEKFEDDSKDSIHLNEANSEFILSLKGVQNEDETSKDADVTTKRKKKIKRRREIEQVYSVSSEEHHSDAATDGFQVQESVDSAKIKLTFKRRKVETTESTCWSSEANGEDGENSKKKKGKASVDDDTCSSPVGSLAADTTTDCNGLHNSYQEGVRENIEEETSSILVEPNPSTTDSVTADFDATGQDVQKESDGPKVQSSTNEASPAEREKTSSFVDTEGNHKHDGEADSTHSDVIAISPIPNDTPLDSPKITSSGNIHSTRSSTDSIERELQAIWNGEVDYADDKKKQLEFNLEPHDVPVVDFYTEDIPTESIYTSTNFNDTERSSHVMGLSNMPDNSLALAVTPIPPNKGLEPTVEDMPATSRCGVIAYGHRGGNSIQDSDRPLDLRNSLLSDRSSFSLDENNIDINTLTEALDDKICDNRLVEPTPPAFIKNITAVTNNMADPASAQLENTSRAERKEPSKIDDCPEIEKSECGISICDDSNLSQGSSSVNNEPTFLVPFTLDQTIVQNKPGKVNKKRHSSFDIASIISEEIYSSESEKISGSGEITKVAVNVPDEEIAHATYQNVGGVYNEYFENKGNFSVVGSAECPNENLENTAEGKLQEDGQSEEQENGINVSNEEKDVPIPKATNADYHSKAINILSSTKIVQELGEPDAVANIEVSELAGVAQPSGTVATLIENNLQTGSSPECEMPANDEVVDSNVDVSDAIVLEKCEEESQSLQTMDHDLNACPSNGATLPPLVQEIEAKQMPGQESLASLVIDSSDCRPLGEDPESDKNAPQVDLLAVTTETPQRDVDPFIGAETDSSINETICYRGSNALVEQKAVSGYENESKDILIYSGSEEVTDNDILDCEFVQGCEVDAEEIDGSVRTIIAVVESDSHSNEATGHISSNTLSTKAETENVKRGLENNTENLVDFTHMSCSYKDTQVIENTTAELSHNIEKGRNEECTANSSLEVGKAESVFSSNLDEPADEATATRPTEFGGFAIGEKSESDANNFEGCCFLSIGEKDESMSVPPSTSPAESRKEIFAAIVNDVRDEANADESLSASAEDTGCVTGDEACVDQSAPLSYESVDTNEIVCMMTCEKPNYPEAVTTCREATTPTESIFPEKEKQSDPIICDVVGRSSHPMETASVPVLNVELGNKLGIAYPISETEPSVVVRVSIDFKAEIVCGAATNVSDQTVGGNDENSAKDIGDDIREMNSFEAEVVCGAVTDISDQTVGGNDENSAKDIGDDIREMNSIEAEVVCGAATDISHQNYENLAKDIEDEITEINSIETEVVCGAVTDISHQTVGGNDENLTKDIEDEITEINSIEAEVVCEVVTDISNQNYENWTKKIGDDIHEMNSIEAEVVCGAATEFSDQNYENLAKDIGDDISEMNSIEAEVVCGAVTDISDQTVGGNCENLAKDIGDEITEINSIEAEVVCEAVTDISNQNYENLTKKIGGDIDEMNSIEVEVVREAATDISDQTVGGNDENLAKDNNEITEMNSNMNEAEENLESVSDELFIHDTPTCPSSNNETIVDIISDASDPNISMNSVFAQDPQESLSEHIPNEPFVAVCIEQEIVAETYSNIEYEVEETASEEVMFVVDEESDENANIILNIQPHENENSIQHYDENLPNHLSNENNCDHIESETMVELSPTHASEDVCVTVETDTNASCEEMLVDKKDSAPSGLPSTEESVILEGWDNVEIEGNEYIIVDENTEITGNNDSVESEEDDTPLAVADIPLPPGEAPKENCIDIEKWISDRINLNHLYDELDPRCESPFPVERMGLFRNPSPPPCDLERPGTPRLVLCPRRSFENDWENDLPCGENSNYFESEKTAIPEEEEVYSVVNEVDGDRAPDDAEFRDVMENCFENAQKFLNGESGNAVDADHNGSKDVLLSAVGETSDVELSVEQSSSDVSVHDSPLFGSIGPEILPVDNWPYLEEEVPSSPSNPKDSEDVIAPFENTEDNCGDPSSENIVQPSDNVDASIQDQSILPPFLCTERSRAELRDIIDKKAKEQIENPATSTPKKAKTAAIRDKDSSSAIDNNSNSVDGKTKSDLQVLEEDTYLNSSSSAIEEPTTSQSIYQSIKWQPRVVLERIWKKKTSTKNILKHSTQCERDEATKGKFIHKEKEIDASMPSHLSQRSKSELTCSIIPSNQNDYDDVPEEPYKNNHARSIKSSDVVQEESRKVCSNTRLPSNAKSLSKVVNLLKDTEKHPNNTRKVMKSTSLVVTSDSASALTKKKIKSDSESDSSAFTVKAKDESKNKKNPNKERKNSSSNKEDAVLASKTAEQLPRLVSASDERIPITRKRSMDTEPDLTDTAPWPNARTSIELRSSIKLNRISSSPPITRKKSIDARSNSIKDLRDVAAPTSTRKKSTDSRSLGQFIANEKEPSFSTTEKCLELRSTKKGFEIDTPPKKRKKSQDSSFCVQENAFEHHVSKTRKKSIELRSPTEEVINEVGSSPTSSKSTDSQLDIYQDIDEPEHVSNTSNKSRDPRSAFNRDRYAVDNSTTGKKKPAEKRSMVNPDAKETRKAVDKDIQQAFSKAIIDCDFTKAHRERRSSYKESKVKKDNVGQISTDAQKKSRTFQLEKIEVPFAAGDIAKTKAMKKELPILESKSSGGKRRHSTTSRKSDNKQHSKRNKTSSDSSNELRVFDIPCESGVITSPWVCVCGFAVESEREKHVQQHSFHCQSCHLAFKSESQFIDHLTDKHNDIRKQHHCLLCELSFDTKEGYQMHLTTREHNHLESVEKSTIHTLFSLLTGESCPLLGPVNTRPEWLPSQAGTVHFYHQATPISLALQYWKLKKEEEQAK